MDSLDNRRNGTSSDRLSVLVFGLIAIVLVFYLANLYLETNFAYNGEAYCKGAGHILRENHIKGLVFLTLQELVVSTIAFFILFRVVDGKFGRLIYKTLGIVCVIILVLTTLYAGTKIYDGVHEGYYNVERITELILTWVYRTAGFFFGYVIAIKMPSLRRSKQRSGL